MADETEILSVHDAAPGENNEAPETLTSDPAVAFSQDSTTVVVDTPTAVETIVKNIPIANAEPRPEKGSEPEPSLDPVNPIQGTPTITLPDGRKVIPGDAEYPYDEVAASMNKDAAILDRQSVAIKKASTALTAFKARFVPKLTLAEMNRRTREITQRIDHERNERIRQLQEMAALIDGS